MSKADNRTLNYYALKLALALKSEDGNDFCREYDNIPTSQLTQEQVEWIKDKARSDSALPHPTLLARMKWFKDKVLPTSTLPTTPPTKNASPKTSPTNAVISKQTESEYHSAVSNLKARMNSIVDNPIMKSGLGSYGDGYGAPALKPSDGNKNYLSVNTETRESLFNGFHEGDIEMVDLSKKRELGYTEINIDDAIEFRQLSQNQDSDENNSGDGKNLDPSGKKKKKKKKRKSLGPEGTQKEENAEKKEGKSRAARRKKLKQIKEEEKGTTRGKLEEGNASGIQSIEPIQSPPETAIVQKKPKRTVASMRRAKEELRERSRFFAQVATNGEGIIPIITLGPSHQNMTQFLQVPASERSTTQPLLHAIEKGSITDTPKAPHVVKAKRTRPDSDDLKSPEKRDEAFPSWVIEHDSRKDKKKKRKSRVGQKTSVQNDSTNSENSNSEHTNNNKQQDTEKSSDRSGSISSPEPTCRPASLGEKEIDLLSDDIVLRDGGVMSDDVLVVDDGPWEMIGSGGKNEKKRKTGEIKQTFSSNQSSLSDKSSLFTEKCEIIKGPANVTSSSTQQPQTISINDSSTPELGVHNEELWPGLTAANAKFPIIKSKKAMTLAQRIRRNKSSDSDSDHVTIPTEPEPAELSDDHVEPAEPEVEVPPSPEVVESEDSILDQILGHKLSGLNFLVGSCEDLTQEKTDPVADAVSEVQNDIRFIFVDDDLDDDIHSDIIQTTPTKNGPVTAPPTAISNTNSSLSGDLVNKLLSNQIAKKIFIQTDVTIPDYHALIKFHEKRLKSVLEREQNGGTKTIRYKPFHDLHEKIETVTSS